MTELYDTICRIVEEKRAARRHPTIALSLEISQRTGWPVFIIEWEMRELERAGIVMSAEPQARTMPLPGALYRNK
mgnify:CR=1 FL=1